MIDFKITFQDDELLYGDYEKMSLISDIMLRKFLRQFKTKMALPPQQGLKTRYCQGNVLTLINLV